MRFKNIVLAFGISVGVLLSPNANADWATGFLTEGRTFADFGPRSLAIDEQGQLHAVYGEDHLYHAYKNGETWTVEVVDDSLSVGRYPTLHITSDGTLAVTYYDSENLSLKFAYKTSGGSWVTETVDDPTNGDNVGKENSLTSDASGTFHVCYYDSTDGALKYASKTSGGSWASEIVDDTTSRMGRYCSIGVNSEGDILVSYYDDSGDNLRFAEKESGAAWTLSTVVSTGSVGAYTSLVVDASDGVHVAYRDNTNSDLYYVYKAAGAAWSTPELAEDDSNVGVQASLDLDSAGGVHILHYDSATGDFYHTYKPAGGSWTSEVVGADESATPSLVVDSSDGLHTVYFDTENQEIDYAYKPSGGSWTAENIDTRANYSDATAVAIDDENTIYGFYYEYYSNTIFMVTQTSGGVNNVETVARAEIVDVGTMAAVVDEDQTVHLVFYSDSLDGASEHSVYYVYKTAGGTWSDKALIAATSYDAYLDLKADAYGNLYLVYYDSTDLSIKFATKSAGASTWSIQTVDDSTETEGDVSLLRDDAGNLHISYLDYTNGDLRYAYQAQGETTWELTTVDSNEYAGSHSSLAMDSEGNLYIAYSVINNSDSTTDLKLATLSAGATEWSLETVEEGGRVGYEAQLQIDSSDRLHILHYDSTNGDLKYATRESGGTTWSTETLDSEAYVGTGLSFVIDSNDRLFALYLDTTLFDVKYAFFSSCGDAHLDDGEVCDDGNTTSGDGCASTCVSESTWYRDSDGDGFGQASQTQYSETQPDGYVNDNSDCDDSSSSINTNGTETCGDNIDQDCDGLDLDCADESNEEDPSSENADTTSSGASGGGGCQLNTMPTAASAESFWILLPFLGLLLHKRRHISE